MSNQAMQEAQTLNLPKDLNLHVANHCLQRGYQILSQTHLVVDFTQVTQGDSAVLALIFSWMRRAKQNKKTFSFKNLPQNIYKLAQAYDVASLLENENAV